MGSEETLARTWVRVAVYAGFAAVVVYPLLILAPLPDLLAVLLAAAFGPLLAVASIGLYHFVKIHRDSVTLQVGVLFNVIAGAMNTAMLIVQLSVNTTMRRYLADTDEVATKEALWRVWRAVDHVQLGLDIVWDIFIGMGTLLIAIAAIGHPRLGKIVGGAGCVIGVLCLAFNFYTFPTPPANAGLIDVGPAVGLWYLAVTIMVVRSLRWADQNISAKSS